MRNVKYLPLFCLPLIGSETVNPTTVVVTKYVVVMPDESLFETPGKMPIVSQDKVTSKWVAQYIATTDARFGMCLSSLEEVKLYLQKQKDIVEQ